jgi:hypothetical protein
MSLQEMNEDKTNDFMRTFKEYVNTVRISAEAGSDPGTNILTINLDSAGFPLATSLPWDEITREKLERLYRAYITQHYSKLIPRLPAFRN